MTALHYWGRRHAPGVVDVLVEGADGRPEPLELHERHSMSHEWGYGGSGPAQLALDLLWRHLEVEPPPALANEFLRSVVALLGFDRWDMSSSDIAAWLGRHLPCEATVR